VKAVAFGLAVFVLLFAVVFWSIRLRDLVKGLRTVPEIDPERYVGLPEDAPLISVIVPAHNEEAFIKDCLESVLAQDYPNFELICVDDRSEDRTVQIVRSVFQHHNHKRCRLLSVTDLPSGWTGKCHALNTAVAHARGQWLAFLDSDSTLGKSALRQCYHEASIHGVNLVSLTPRFLMRTFWEKVLQPTFGAMCCMLFPLGKVNDPSSDVAFANGMFYMISRPAYERIGGHRVVRNLAVEDVGIGKMVKALGLGILMANGCRIMQTRMYTNFHDIVKGWTRILSASMNYELPTAIKCLSVHTLMSFPVLVAVLYIYVPTAMELWPYYWFIPVLVCGVQMVVVPSVFYSSWGLPRRRSACLILGNLVLIWVLAVIVKKIVCKDCLQWRGTTYFSSLYEPRNLDLEPPPVYSPIRSNRILEKAK